MIIKRFNEHFFLIYFKTDLITSENAKCVIRPGRQRHNATALVLRDVVCDVNPRIRIERCVELNYEIENRGVVLATWRPVDLCRQTGQHLRRTAHEDI
jgi:hypothetical protein